MAETVVKAVKVVMVAKVVLEESVALVVLAQVVLGQPCCQCLQS